MKSEPTSSNTSWSLTLEWAGGRGASRRHLEWLRGSLWGGREEGGERERERGGGRGEGDKLVHRFCCSVAELFPPHTHMQTLLPLWQTLSKTNNSRCLPWYLPPGAHSCSLVLPQVTSLGGTHTAESAVGLHGG